MKTIITIQHTQSVHHTNGMVGSWTDWDLTELGIEQAKRIGEKLGTELSGKTFVMYSSDLKRAKQTADAVARIFGGSACFTQGVTREKFRKMLWKVCAVVEGKSGNTGEDRR